MAALTDSQLMDTETKSKLEEMEESSVTEKTKLTWKQKVWRELRPDKRLFKLKILSFLFFGGES